MRRTAGALCTVVALAACTRAWTPADGWRLGKPD
jgi:hypothetical protein